MYNLNNKDSYVQPQKQRDRELCIVSMFEI